jgi:hypothetical protein
VTDVVVTATEQTDQTASLMPRATETTSAFPRERLVPLTMPSAQEYYWHHGWQRGERETLVSLEDGQGVTFDSDDPEDIVRWLHDDEDSDTDSD